jgi:hypothetical protein
LKLEQGDKVQSPSSSSLSDPNEHDVAPLVPILEPPLHAPPRRDDQLVGDRPSIGRRMFRALVRFFIAVLIGVGATLAWQSYGDEARKSVRTWAPSLVWLLPVSTPKSMQQLEPITRDLAAVRSSLEQLAVKQEQMAQNIATLQAVVEQDIGQKMSSPLPSQAVPLPPRKPQQPAAQSSRHPQHNQDRAHGF